MTIVLALSAYFVGGIAAGAVYFRCLWWNVQLFADGGGTAATVLLMAGRIVALGCLLTLASRQGALPLLMMALGVMIVRFAVVRALRTVAP